MNGRLKLLLGPRIKQPNLEIDAANVFFDDMITERC